MAAEISVVPYFIFVLLVVVANYLLASNGVSCFEANNVLNLQSLYWNKHGDTNNCFFTKSRKKKGAFIFEMKHIDFCSLKKLDWNSKIKKQLISDNLHVQSIQNQIHKLVSGNNTQQEYVSETPIPLFSGVSLRTLNYIVTVELGGQNMTLIVDTGSDLTWVQCLPCKSCYDQKGPLFNPSLSTSYHSVVCNSSTCQSLQFATGNLGSCGSNTNTSSCGYAVSYGDGSYSYGDLAIDHVNLGNTSVSDFVFGCGRSNKGLFGGASGLMGLGKSDLSLVFQTSSVFGGVFSYCLPSTEAGDSGSLVMGGGSEYSSLFKNVTPISYTRTVLNPQLPTFYILNLTGISIGGVDLKASSFGKNGILIDSGTVISRLAPSVYKAVKTEFLKQFSMYQFSPGFSILDTCFNLTGYQEVNIPIMKMYFEGNAEMKVDASGMFYLVKSDASQVCLALASLSDEYQVGIIGNYQQRNQRVIYDTKQSMVGFAGEPCSFL